MILPNKSHKPRTKLRRKEDRKKRTAILHAAKHVIQAENFLNEAIDTLLKLSGLTKEDL